MAEPNDIKSQRDRFLAFAFASADLFLEVGEQGKVVFALGAAKSLTGIDPQTLIGRNWLELFAAKNRTSLSKLETDAKDGRRAGPLLVSMDESLTPGKEAIVTSIRMPGRKNLYLTVGFPSMVIKDLASRIVEIDEDYELLNRGDFIFAAQEALTTARSMGQNLEMTLFDIANTQEIKQKIGEEKWTEFVEKLTDYLGSRSVDGQSIAEIADGRYSIIHSATVKPGDLHSGVQAIAKSTDPDGFEVASKSVAADLQSLSERETVKALIYTISEFERKGTALNIDSFNKSFKTYVSVNAHKIQQFKSMVEQLSFDFHYLPICSLEDNSLSHFEMLTRFHKGGSTQEWVVFAEDIGMAADFDIAVCERAINYILYKSAGHGTKFALNLSGQSIQNEQFFKTLLAKLTMSTGLANRLIFEITESTNITQFQMVNDFIKTLQKHKFKVCLDDFGTGASSLEYLQKLEVDYVKIDGMYSSKALESERDSLLLKNLAKMCADLDIAAIAERIETKEQADMFKSMNIPLGQGYYFSYPTTKPDYDPAKILKDK